MGYNFIILMKKTICRFFGHKQGYLFWEHQSQNSVCIRCGTIYKSGGFYKLRSFKSASKSCNVNESIYRFKNKLYAKNHTIPLKKRIGLLDRLSKDWVINDTEPPM